MEKKSTLCVVIPIYNEEKELEENITKLHSFLSRKVNSYDWKITIADNASNDRSMQIARKLAKKYKEVQVLHLDQKGRGRAVKKAWRESKAEFVSYMDVDLSTDLKHFPALLKALKNGYDLAIASRLLPESKVVNRTPKREIISRAYNILIRILFHTHFSDAQCGFKAATGRVVKELIPHVLDNTWFFDSELLILADKTGYKIYEEPVLWIDNPGSTVRVLKTITGDLKGLWRLFWTKPWKKLKYIH